VAGTTWLNGACLTACCGLVLSQRHPPTHPRALPACPCTCLHRLQAQTKQLGDLTTLLEEMARDLEPIKLSHMRIMERVGLAVLMCGSGAAAIGLYMQYLKHFT